MAQTHRVGIGLQLKSGSVLKAQAPTVTPEGGAFLTDITNLNGGAASGKRALDPIPFSVDEGDEEDMCSLGRQENLPKRSRKEPVPEVLEQEVENFNDLAYYDEKLLWEGLQDIIRTMNNKEMRQLLSWINLGAEGIIFHYDSNDYKVNHAPHVSRAHLIRRLRTSYPLTALLTLLPLQCFERYLTSRRNIVESSIPGSNARDTSRRLWKKRADGGAHAVPDPLFGVVEFSYAEEFNMKEAADDVQKMHPSGNRMQQILQILQHKASLSEDSVSLVGRPAAENRNALRAMLYLIRKKMMRITVDESSVTSLPVSCILRATNNFQWPTTNLLGNFVRFLLSLTHVQEQPELQHQLTSALEDVLQSSNRRRGESCHCRSDKSCGCMECSVCLRENEDWFNESRVLQLLHDVEGVARRPADDWESHQLVKVDLFDYQRETIQHMLDEEAAVEAGGMSRHLGWLQLPLPPQPAPVKKSPKKQKPKKSSAGAARNKAATAAAPAPGQPTIPEAFAQQTAPAEAGSTLNREARAAAADEATAPSPSPMALDTDAAAATAPASPTGVPPTTAPMEHTPTPAPPAAASPGESQGGSPDFEMPSADDASPERVGAVMSGEGQGTSPGRAAGEGEGEASPHTPIGGPLREAPTPLSMGQLERILEVSLDGPKEGMPEAPVGAESVPGSFVEGGPQEGCTGDVSPDDKELEAEEVPEAVVPPRMEFSPRFDLIKVVDDKLESLVFQTYRARTPEVPKAAGGIVAEEMGMGKTVEAIALIVGNPATAEDLKPVDMETARAHMEQGMPTYAIKSTLIIVPPALIGQWEDELKKIPAVPLKVFRYYGGRRYTQTAESLGDYDAVLTTPMVAVSQYSQLLRAVLWHRIIWDESHLTCKIRGLGDFHSRRRWCLTGTPAPALLEQYALLGFKEMRLLMRECSCSMGFLMKQTMVRHTKEKVDLKLPPLTLERVEINLLPEEKALYEKVREGVSTRVESWSMTNHANVHSIIQPLRVGCSGAMVSQWGSPLSQLYPDRSLCVGCFEGPVQPQPCGHGLCQACYSEGISYCPACCNKHLRTGGYDDGASSYDARGVIVFSKVREVIKRMMRIRRTKPQAKMLIFSNFAVTLQVFKEEIEARQFVSRDFKGYMDLKDRIQALEMFKYDPPTTVFLLSATAGAVGLNLTAASEIFLLEPLLSPTMELQAINRAHRLGQKQPVTVHRLIAMDTIEERVVRLNLERRSKVLDCDGALLDESAAATGVEGQLLLCAPPAPLAVKEEAAMGSTAAPEVPSGKVKEEVVEAAPLGPLPPNLVKSDAAAFRGRMADILYMVSNGPMDVREYFAAFEENQGESS